MEETTSPKRVKALIALHARSQVLRSGEKVEGERFLFLFKCLKQIFAGAVTSCYFFGGK